jgi:peptidyl-dipeptidase A
LVSSFESKLAGLETEFHEAYWQSQIDASPESEQRRAELEVELRRVKGDEATLAQVNEALEEDIHEPLLARQLEVLRLSLTGNQMTDEQRSALVELSTEVESEYASYRAELDGKRITENEVDEILATSTDEDLRRRAWEASKGIGGRVSDRIRELARLRNEVARNLGFADYYNFALDLQEIDDEWLFEVLGELESMTDEPFREWKSSLDKVLSQKFGTETLYPWHYADPFFQTLPPDGKVDLSPLLTGKSAPDLADQTFSKWDIDLSHVMELSDLYPREKKSQHAFCLHVDRGDDVRILANVVPGERWVEVMLHESGHAAYDVSIDQSLPYLLRRAAHTFVTEAIAIMSGRMVRRPDWLMSIAGAEPAGVKEIEAELRATSAAQSLMFMRWGLVVVHFERALYADPEGDLDAQWWDLVERLQLVNRPPGRTAPDWAAKIHVAAAPAYYQNYLLGEMLASQLERTALDETSGLVGEPEAGRLLRDRIFTHGSAKRWDQLVKDATGKPLSAEDFAAGVKS